MATLLLSDEHRAAQLAAFHAHTAPIRAAITQQAPLFERVRQNLQSFWEHLADGKTFPRKPPFGLRLLAADSQILVALSPDFTYRPKALHPERLVIDVIVEVERYVAVTAPTPLHQLDRVLELWTTRARTSWRRLSRTCTLDTVAALTTLLTDFVDDPAAVLRRSTGHCCICGRVLTDGQSQARGIGPECLKHFSTLLGSQQSIFGWMETMADLEEASHGQ